MFGFKKNKKKLKIRKNIRKNNFIIFSFIIKIQIYIYIIKINQNFYILKLFNL